MTARYAFIDAEKAQYSIVKMCAWMGVSTSGFYEWRDRPPSATAQRRARLATLIEWIFNDSDHTYGHRRVHAALARQGERVTAELVRAGLPRRHSGHEARRGHHLSADLAGLAVPRHGDRLPHQGVHRVRDGRAHARRTGHRCVADGRP